MFLIHGSADSGLRALNFDALQRGEIGRQLGFPAGYLLSLKT